MKVVPTLEVSDSDIGDVLRQIVRLFDFLPPNIPVQGGTVPRSEHLKTHLQMATESCNRIAARAFELGLNHATPAKGESQNG